MLIDFIKKESFKLLFLFYFSISYPFYSISKIAFTLVTIILLLCIMIYWDNLNKKKHFEKLSDWFMYTIYMPWIQPILIWLILLVIISILAKTRYNESIILIIFFCWTFSLSILFYVTKNIISIIKKLKEVVNSTNYPRKKINFLLFFSLFMIFIIPDFAFSFCYNLFLNSFANIDLSAFVFCKQKV